MKLLIQDFEVENASICAKIATFVQICMEMHLFVREMSAGYTGRAFFLAKKEAKKHGLRPII